MNSDQVISIWQYSNIHAIYTIQTYQSLKKWFHINMWNDSLIARQRLNFLVLLVLWVKGVGNPPLWYTLVLWVWGFPYLLIVTPFGWLMVLYLLLGPSTLIVCTFTKSTLILWFLFCKTIRPLVPYPKSTFILWFLFF